MDEQGIEPWTFPSLDQPVANLMLRENYTTKPFAHHLFSMDGCRGIDDFGSDAAAFVFCCSLTRAIVKCEQNSSTTLQTNIDIEINISHRTNEVYSKL